MNYLKTMSFDSWKEESPMGIEEIECQTHHFMITAFPAGGTSI